MSPKHAATPRREREQQGARRASVYAQRSSVHQGLSPRRGPDPVSRDARYVLAGRHART